MAEKSIITTRLLSKIHYHKALIKLFTEAFLYSFNYCYHTTKSYDKLLNCLITFKNLLEASGVTEASENLREITKMMEPRVQKSSEPSSGQENLTIKPSSF